MNDQLTDRDPLDQFEDEGYRSLVHRCESNPNIDKFAFCGIGNNDYYFTIIADGKIAHMKTNANHGEQLFETLPETETPIADLARGNTKPNGCQVVDLKSASYYSESESHLLLETKEKDKIDCCMLTCYDVQRFIDKLTKMRGGATKSEQRASIGYCLTLPALIAIFPTVIFAILAMFASGPTDVNGESVNYFASFYREYLGTTGALLCWLVCIVLLGVWGAFRISKPPTKHVYEFTS